jgi:hypothetical protein
LELFWVEPLVDAFPCKENSLQNNAQVEGYNPDNGRRMHAFKTRLLLFALSLPFQHAFRLLPLSFPLRCRCLYFCLCRLAFALLR